MTQKLRIKVPDAPRDLFRSLQKQIKKDRDSFNMNYWHADDHGNFADNAKGIRCSTVHCMAGWITVLTPGGLQLEAKLAKRFNGMSNYGGELPEYVEQADMETPAAALLILEKAGWAGLIKHKDFFLSSARALRLINKLAKIEATRARSRRPKKKAA